MVLILGGMVGKEEYTHIACVERLIRWVRYLGRLAEGHSPIFFAIKLKFIFNSFLFLFPKYSLLGISE